MPVLHTGAVLAACFTFIKYSPRSRFFSYFVFLICPLSSDCSDLVLLKQIFFALRLFYLLFFFGLLWLCHRQSRFFLHSGFSICFSSSNCSGPGYAKADFSRILTIFSAFPISAVRTWLIQRRLFSYSYCFICFSISGYSFPVRSPCAIPFSRKSNKLKSSIICMCRVKTGSIRTG